MLKRKELSLSSIFVYSLLLNAGSSFMWPLVTMYINDYLHKSLMVSGFTLLMMSLCMILGNYLGGYLFDRWSAYKTSMIGISVSSIAIVLLIFFHGWPIFAFLLMFLGLGDGMNLTLLNSYATKVTSKSSRYVFNLLYIGLNLGVVIGTAMVGYLLKFGVHTVFVTASFFYVVLWIMTLLKFDVDFSENTNSLASNAVKPNKQLTTNHNKSIIYSICLMVFFIYLSYTLWESVMSVHMVNMGISFEKYSTLWTINGLIIVLGQPIVNHLGRRFNMQKQIFLGVFIFGISFILLLLTKSYVSFVAVMVILTVGEIMGLPDVPAWIDNLSSPIEKGKYQGFFNSFMSFGRALSPLYGGLFVEYLGYNSLFIISTVFILGSLIYVMHKNKKAVS
ncbi:MDR family MFS transporter [Apilactobacillus xinyiensis]|uniref:MDR family MFS transporter n=1 Tax=Apilactobacillus xinyiensis TaxID=2841032 RepID=UPI002010580C|nr:MFS transporter [Apilactobacillus xinyiensis]MCL0319450.1 MFS transporter [Apilactobacillus xinyiensis]MCL0330521.1 MFS transporter [Apilactobacillus xinyiensis]